MNRVNFSHLDKTKLNTHMIYYSKYYGADFRPNQGLNEITDMIHRYSIPGDWIDLGGGTSSYMWLPAFQPITNFISVDCDVEALFVQDCVRNEQPSGCYRHILSRYNRNLEELRAIPVDYFMTDLFSKDLIVPQTFDNVSQIGLLGLCLSKEEYLNVLSSLFCFVKACGIFLGANWIFSESYSKEVGHSNKYITADLLNQFTTHRGIRLLYEELVPIKNDKNYDGVFLYTLKA